MRTIDADALKEIFDITFFNDEDDYKKALRIIDNAPTVHNPNCDICEDKAKQYSSGFQDGYMTGKARPQGEWEFSINHTTPKYPWGMYKCSNCNNWNGSKVRFCPNCGADMRGKEE